MTRILINGRFLFQKQTGVNRFAYELSKSLVSLRDDILFICPHGDIQKEYDVRNFNIVRFGYGKSHIWEQLYLPLFCLRYTNSTLLNFTGIGPICVSNKIITIHDLAFLVEPSWYSKSYATIYKWLSPISAKTSRYILTVSEFSKSEIIKYLAVNEDKIHVIYNAVSDSFIPSIDKKRNDYILAVSTLDPRKNFNRLVEAYDLWHENAMVKLCVVGGQNSIYSDIKCKESSMVDWLGRVDDGQLISLYQNALCFIYPSLYEGFGLPPLEAMACGTPVIVSDIPPHHEVCGEAAIYVNPHDTNSIREALKQIMNKNKRDDMSQRGLLQTQKFSWGKSAERLMDIIASI